MSEVDLVSPFSAGDISGDLQSFLSYAGISMGPAKLATLSKLISNSFNMRFCEIVKERGIQVVCRKDDGKWACDEHTGFARADHDGVLFITRKRRQAFEFLFGDVANGRESE